MVSVVEIEIEISVVVSVGVGEISVVVSVGGVSVVVSVGGVSVVVGISVGGVWMMMVPTSLRLVDTMEVDIGETVIMVPGVEMIEVAVEVSVGVVVSVGSG